MKLDFNGKDQPEVVIVEDEAIVALDLQFTLEKMGCFVSRIVDTAAAAVQSIVDTKPDAIIMDIILRGSMDGIEAAKKIRETSDVPIIFATGDTEESTMTRVHVISSSVFISKPIISSSLFVALQDMFSQPSLPVA